MSKRFSLDSSDPHPYRISPDQKQNREKLLRLESCYGLGIHIVKVFLTLVFYRREIVQYANRGVG